MRITFKLYATLACYLPADAINHRVSLEVPEQTTAHDLIDRFNVAREKAHLVMKNGIYLYPEERDRPELKEGDTIAVWPPVAGG